MFQYVHFGQKLPQKYRSNYKKDFQECDLLIVCGTSMQVEPVCSLPNYLDKEVPCVLMNKEKVKEKGNKAKQFFDGIKTAFSMGMADYSGIFDFENKDLFIGGDVQKNCYELIKKLGWEDEFESLKKETNSSEHPLVQLISDSN